MQKVLISTTLILLIRLIILDDNGEKITNKDFNHLIKKQNLIIKI